MNEIVFKHLLIRTANVAIGPSTLRNQGDAGVVQAARDALKLLTLEDYSAAVREGVGELLDAHTEFVRRRLPRAARNWGAARKALNIFLRDVLYSRYLCREYGLAKLESLLEVPLDRDIATRLLAEPEGEGLPKWGTIKRLTPEASEQYQAVARRVAKRMGTHPVHLDVLYWGRSQA
ncbi:hypothetical protein KOR34_37410 [Posidoniimonas corsicana]|uniref:Uncharacterized protein n=1 Tax=Posidoniimonas corsicana TaxID=1938618 RepID=A0A5C5V847_9BACT|nr:hypothetical protein [Posidoniimonas corsicana]TWT33905.1 hypothetical protein KOR34_37410 [Posidoniimonas corsicana]